MTTSQRSASRLRPSRICRFLICAVMVKICLVGSMLMEPFFSGSIPSPFFSPSSAAVAAVSQKSPQDSVESTSILATATAHAAEATPAPAEAAPAPQSGLSREAMQRRQEVLVRKEQDLRTLESDLDDRLIRLQELEVRLKAMLKEADEVKSAKFKHLVGVLGNMKAKQAASVLETLDEKIAVKVLSGMNGRQAGEILTFVNPGKAARLAEALARVQLPFE